MNNLVNVRLWALTLLSCAGIVVASSAFALTITNLSDIPYDLDMTLAGETQQISIEPGRSWSTQANPVSVAMGKRLIRLEPGSEYAIWKDGTFAQQRRSNLDRKR